MKAFVMDLVDGCKPSQQPKNWWFYLMCAAILVISIIGVLASIVSMVIFGAAHNFQVLPLIMMFVFIAFFVAIVIVVNKLR